MHMFLRRSSGRRLEAVLLAVSNNQLRVAAPGYQDALELTLAGGQWTSPRGDVFDLESIVADGRIDMSVFCADLRPRTMAAGQSIVYQ